MILYEFEGKRLLFEAGINVPVSQLVESPNQDLVIKSPLVLKAQVLSGKRAEVGGIVICDTLSTIDTLVSQLLNKTINGEKVEKVLVEEKIDYEKEYYVSISYDTDVRSTVLTVSSEGGTGVEKHESKVYPINPLQPYNDLPNNIDKELIKKLIDLFFDQDLLLLEINPLVKTKEDKWIALDAKIKLDDDARVRHMNPTTGSGQGWNYPLRLPGGRTPTQREIEAKKIDEGDYRGTAGSAYFDLDGDIAILSSGGGVSLTAMDALINAGGKPANFTEYSGNPPKEKVIKLTKVVLSKPNIKGLWVVGTVAANFTDIYETLSGVVEGLRQAQAESPWRFNFPIVIRRGGPRDKEAFEILKQVTDLNLILQGEETSIAQSAAVIAEKAKEYATKH